MDVIIVILLLGLAAGYFLLNPRNSEKLIIYLAGAFLLGVLILCALYGLLMML